MNKMKKIQKEEKDSYMNFLSEYIAKIIQIHFKYYGNKNANTYTQVFNGAIDEFVLSEEELHFIYKKVDYILEKKYGLIFAHNEKNIPIHLVDISGKDDNIC